MTDCDKCKEYNKEKNYCPVFCNVINDTLTDKVIEELEKLKGEFEEFEDSDYVCDWVWSADKVYDLIDNRIKELKGI